MRTIARFVVPFAAAMGLAMAFGPAAGAATSGFGARPVTQAVNFATDFSIVNGCNGSTVDTTGHGTVTTTTVGQRTTVTIVDRESGDGYQLAIAGGAEFKALASTYLVPVKALWVNRDPALDFHASYSYTVTVNSKNAATSFLVYGVSGTCGL
jgi:hypothetical protein